MTVRQVTDRLYRIAGWLDRHGHEAEASVAAALTDVGYPSSGGAGRRAPGVPDPTGRIATDPSQDTTVAREYQDALDQLEHAARRVLRFGPQLVAGDVDDGPGSAPGAGTCRACERTCDGGPDRLRSGLCAADYRAWNRAKATEPDFGAWLARRRRLHGLDTGHQPGLPRSEGAL